MSFLTSEPQKSRRGDWSWRYGTTAKSEIRAKKKPSRYPDIELLAGFTEKVLATWSETEPVSVPCKREFDKFLMMYGKHLKRPPAP